MKNVFKVKKIPVEKTYPIRQEILRKGTNLPVIFDGDTAADTFHLGAFQSGTLVGIATLVRATFDVCTAEKQYQLRGMATLEKVRGQGAGKALLIEAVRQLKEKQIEVLWCNARVIAIDFYKKIGFKTVGEAFDVPQIGWHYKMICEM